MSLFVGNISESVNREDLEKEFLKFGKCTIRHKVLPISNSLSLFLSVTWALSTSLFFSGPE